MAIGQYGPAIGEKSSSTQSSTEFRIPMLEQSELDKDLLVISPYTDDPHLLDLTTLERQDQIIARALTSLYSLREDYAIAPYVEIFNWADVISRIKYLSHEIQHTWKRQIYYIVVFRSQVLPNTNYTQLGVLDSAAHAEAVKSGGFLKYWFGSPDAQGRNLATCVWRSQEDARLGGRGPAHLRAAGLTRHLYASWKIERLALEIKDGAIDWEIRGWED